MVASYKSDLLELAKKFNQDFIPVFLVPSKRKKYEPPEFMEQYRWEGKDGSVFQYSPKSKEISCVNRETIYYLSIKKGGSHEL